MNWLGSISANQTTILRSHFHNLLSWLVFPYPLLWHFYSFLQDKELTNILVARKFWFGCKRTQYETDIWYWELTWALRNIISCLARVIRTLVLFIAPKATQDISIIQYKNTVDWNLYADTLKCFLLKYICALVLHFTNNTH